MYIVYEKDSRLVKGDAETETAELVKEDIERFGDAGGGHGIAFDNGFVSFGTTGDIVGLDGEDFLEDVACTEGFDGPDLHLSETLTTELGFTAEGLLRDERVGSDGTGVHFVFDHVTEFEHVGHTDSSFLVEAFARGTVVELGGAVAGKSGFVGPLTEIFEVGTIEDGGWRT